MRRRLRLQHAIVKYLPHLRYTLLVVGYAWLLALPWPLLGQDTYADEHALQPGLVDTSWGWDDVHAADSYLEQLTALRSQNVSRSAMAHWLKSEFITIGLSSATQEYALYTNKKVIHGINTYAIFPAPMSSGAEAMVISASWLSRIDEEHGAVNERGISVVLALARFLARHSYWAKDLVFVISDNYLDGMQAWLSSYHGSSQSNLYAEPLEFASGVIWTAFNIDYPGHSFSHIGLFYEGLNGRLPNQDLMNSTHGGGVPLVLHDDIEALFSFVEHHGKPGWKALAARDTHAYLQRMKHILRYFPYHVVGRPSGVHGLFHQFRIDAITLYAVPAHGPHGFHSMGKLVESALRATNNLSERLHASFFFYVMVGPISFLTVRQYLPSAIILSISITLTGISIWREAGMSRSLAIQAKFPSQGTKTRTDKLDQPTNSTRELPCPGDAGAILLRYLSSCCSRISLARCCWFSYALTPSSGFSKFVFVELANLKLTQFSPQFGFLSIAVTCGGFIFASPSPPRIVDAPSGRAPLVLILQSFTLLLTGMVVSTVAVLNFALAASLGAILAVPLVSVGPESNRAVKFLHLVLAAPLLASSATIQSIVRDWYVLGGWFLPFACVIYVPIVLQTWIASVYYI